MKKIISFTFFLFTACASLLAQPSPEKVSFTISSGKVNLGKKNNVAEDWTLVKALNYLGTAPRIRDGYNTTHTYDEMGVVLFEGNNADKTPSGKISEIQVHFSMPEPNDVIPKEGFTGNLTIEKLKIKSSTSLAEIRSKLKGYSDSQSYIEHSYRLAKGGIYFYFQFNKEETELVKVSFGQDKRKS